MREGPQWVQGSVVDVLGPRSYPIQVSNRELWRRHLDHIRDRGSRDQSPTKNRAEAVDIEKKRGEAAADEYPVEHYREGLESPCGMQNSMEESAGDTVEPSTSTPEDPPSARRYPSRVRQGPDRLM